VFSDLVKHFPNHKQTPTYASSVDPWHQASNRVTNQEQPGLDIVFQSGITRGLPATMPIPMMYSTPANAAAEVRYLEAQGYSIARIEMGEEPDGQYVTPEDDAAYYAQFATALHAVDPSLETGRAGIPEQSAGREGLAGREWRDFLDQTLLGLSGQPRTSRDLSFFSFEHYPFRGLRQYEDAGGSAARTRFGVTHRRCVAERWVAGRHADLHYRNQLFAE
jgi:hypothetical protein